MPKADIIKMEKEVLIKEENIKIRAQTITTKKENNGV
jgi:hypothetical protein